MVIKTETTKQPQTVRYDSLMRSSKSELVGCIENYQKEGLIKKCVNIEISANSPFNPFIASCNQDSWKISISNKELRIHLCPPTCKFYKSTTQVAIQSKIKFFFRSLLTPILWLRNWFKQLKSRDQLYLVLFTIIVLGIKFFPHFSHAVLNFYKDFKR